jgi:hypothetical protein
MGSFLHTLDYCELIEFALQNRKFTWSNERRQLTLVRLDRMFCNTEWDLIFPDFTLKALSSSLSDHCHCFSISYSHLQERKFSGSKTSGCVFLGSWRSSRMHGSAVCSESPISTFYVTSCSARPRLSSCGAKVSLPMQGLNCRWRMTLSND